MFKVGSGRHDVQDLKSMIRLLYVLIWENATYISRHNDLGMGVPPQARLRTLRAY
jgi:hypothetical protein